MRSRVIQSHSGTIRTLGLVLCVLFLLPSEAWLQSRKPMTIAELVTYNGADREQVLYNGAKTEGKITWYTSSPANRTRRSVSETPKCTAPPASSQRWRLPRMPSTSRR